MYPATPSNVTASNTSTTDKVKITWSLTNQNADEAADSLTVTLQYSDRTLFEEYTLSGDETEISVDVGPGMDYWVSVSANNPDGTRTSTATPFRSQPAGEYTNYKNDVFSNKGIWSYVVQLLLPF